jgi:hypothetical protein
MKAPLSKLSESQCLASLLRGRGYLRLSRDPDTVGKFFLNTAINDKPVVSKDVAFLFVNPTYEKIRFFEALKY